jgi:hypothetical protein
MYLTSTEFCNICPECDISEEQFSAILQRAESDIDTLTFNRITAEGIDSFTDFQRERIKRSAALQMKFIYDNSELLESPLSAYSISGVSMSFNKSKVVSLDGVITTRQVYNVLMQTGLCYRGLM